MSKSNVEHLRESIHNEYEVAQRGLNGLAITANHASITARMEQMYMHIQALCDQGRNDEARSLLENDDLWSM